MYQTPFRLFTFLLICLTIPFLSMSNKSAYQVFTGNGDVSSYEHLLKEAMRADVILFGELHNNPICHWLQLELTQDLHQTKGDLLILGAEMFESDNQLLVDEYLKDMISKKSFEDEARLWKNYTTDYKPLLEFAKTNKLPFVATNIPRRYASAVFSGGMETLNRLSAEAKTYIAPLPIEIDLTLPGYQAMLNMGGHGAENSENMPKAQAVKDATMAYFIGKKWNKGKQFIHYHGTYHSNNYEGIVWYLKKQNPEIKILTIASVEQNNIQQLEEDHQKLADFILCIPSNMTKTH
ncbi:MAG: ChaN family lipoprotein [Sphingobacteriales bacterium]|nr:MAG: ChaN family lipoprotein [Sphingobacteriales bacterium]